MREINDAELISVRNRNNGSTGYTLDNNFHRDFWVCVILDILK